VTRAGRPDRGEFLTSVLDWFRDADNRKAVQVRLAVLLGLVAWETGLPRWLVALLTHPAKEKPMPQTLRQTEHTVRVIGGRHILFLDNLPGPVAGWRGAEVVFGNASRVEPSPFDMAEHSRRMDDARNTLMRALEAGIGGATVATREGVPSDLRWFAPRFPGRKGSDTPLGRRHSHLRGHPRSAGRRA
jgi:hypothetical protein